MPKVKNPRYAIIKHELSKTSFKFGKNAIESRKQQSPTKKRRNEIKKRMERK